MGLGHPVFRTALSGGILLYSLPIQSVSLSFLLCILLTIWLFYRGFLATQRGFPGGSAGKESACQCRGCRRLRFDLWVGKTTTPPEEGMASHSSILT